jgi:hypothetical protein
MSVCLSVHHILLLESFGPLWDRCLPLASLQTLLGPLPAPFQPSDPFGTVLGPLPAPCQPLEALQFLRVQNLNPTPNPNRQFPGTSLRPASGGATSSHRTPTSMQLTRDRGSTVVEIYCGTDSLKFVDT